MTRAILFHFVADRGRLETMAAALFAAIATGVLITERGQSFSLADAAAAHELLEARRASHPLLLVP